MEGWDVEEDGGGGGLWLNLVKSGGVAFRRTFTPTVQYITGSFKNKAGHKT